MTDWWQDLRAHFPLCERRAYFFAGAQAPLATEVRDAIAGFLDLWNERAWRFELTEWRWFEEAATLLGSVLECDPLRIVAAESTSHAMNLAAAMVLARWTRDGRPPANVVLHHESHPASSYAWVNAARLGSPLEMRWPRPEGGMDPVDALESAIDERTLAVVATHVSHLTGERLDVIGLHDRFPERRWALLLDAAQSAGALPLAAEVQVCDFVGMPAYKWLLGPPGIGFLVVTPDWLEAVGPPFAGWASAKDVWAMDPERLELAPGGTAFRLGMPNFLGMAGAVAGLRLWTAAGSERIASRIRLLTDRLLTGLAGMELSSPTPTEWSRRAGLVAVDMADADGVMTGLFQSGIEVGVEVNRLRVDPHAYNSEDEVDRLLEHLTAVSRSTS